MSTEHCNNMIKVNSPTATGNHLLQGSFLVKLGLTNKFAFTRDNRPVYRTFVCTHLPTDDSSWYDKFFLEMKKHAIQLCYLGRGRPASVSDLRHDDYIVSFFYFDYDDDLVVFDTAKELSRILLFASTNAGSVGCGGRIKIKADVTTKPDRILGRNNSIDSTTQLCASMYRQMKCLGQLESTATSPGPTSPQEKALQHNSWNNKGLDASSVDSDGILEFSSTEIALRKLIQLQHQHQNQKNKKKKQKESSPRTRSKPTHNSLSTHENTNTGSSMAVVKDTTTQIDNSDSFALFYVVDASGSTVTESTLPAANKTSSSAPPSLPLLFESNKGTSTANNRKSTSPTSLCSVRLPPPRSNPKAVAAIGTSIWTSSSPTAETNSNLSLMQRNGMHSGKKILTSIIGCNNNNNSPERNRFFAENCFSADRATTTSPGAADTANVSSSRILGSTITVDHEEDDGSVDIWKKHSIAPNNRDTVSKNDSNKRNNTNNNFDHSHNDNDSFSVRVQCEIATQVSI